MIIEDQEGLNGWLIVVLEPLCDADPDALARYIFALLKKDKPIPELKKGMREQLDVFLQSETAIFVETLFKVIETRDYTTVVPNSGSASAVTTVTTTTATTTSTTTTTSSSNTNTIQTTSTLSNTVQKIPLPSNGVEANKASKISEKGYKSPVDVKPDISKLPLKSSSECENASATKNKSLESPPMKLLEPHQIKREKDDSVKKRTPIKAPVGNEALERKSRRRVRQKRSSPSSQSNKFLSRGSPNSTHSTGHSQARRRMSSSPRYDTRRSISPLQSRTHSQSPARFFHSRSRSRSWGRRSRSYDRGRRKPRTLSRGKKSPRFRRSRSRSRSPLGIRSKPKSRSRSPLYRKHFRSFSSRNSVRSRSWSSSRSRSRSRSRSSSWSVSMSPRGRSPSKSHSRSRSVSKRRSRDVATPTQDSNHGDFDMRLNTTSQSIKSAINTSCDGSSVNSSTTDTITTAVAPTTALTIPTAAIPLPVGPVVLPPSANTAIDKNKTSNNAGSLQFNPGIKGRCRDYDEMGYCMRGDLCPFDHGVDPVVLEDVGIAPSAMLNFGVAAPAVPPPATLPAVIRGLDMSVPPPNIITQQLSSNKGLEEYNPSAPNLGTLPWPTTYTIAGNQGIATVPPPSIVSASSLYTPPAQRELISVPVVDNNKMNLDARVNTYSVGIQQVEEQNEAVKRQKFDFSRLGPPRHKNSFNCSLEVKKIPRGLNNIYHLNNHFSKFGKIINMNINYGGDPEAAVITFATHAEANAAYRSTEAILNNRFIKVFWHSPPIISEQDSIKLQEDLCSLIRESAKESSVLPPSSLSSQAGESIIEKCPLASGHNHMDADLPTSSTDTHISSVPSVTATSTQLSSNTVSTAPFPPSVLVKPMMNSSLSNSSNISGELKLRDTLKITSDLRKRQQQLLERLLNDQRSLVQKLEKKEYSKPEHRTEYLAAIKKLQEHIDKIRQDLKAPLTVKEPKLLDSPHIHLKKKTKEEIQREILDTELDLLTKQNDGLDITELKKKLDDLKMQAQVLGVSSTPPFGQAKCNNFSQFSQVGVGTTSCGYASSFRKRGQSSTPVSVEERFKIQVSGYESDEKEDVISHFEQYGEITDIVVDNSTPSLVLTYGSRNEAEQAILYGRNFQDRNLFINWCTNPVLHTTRGISSRYDSKSRQHKSSTTSSFSEEELLAVDDEYLDFDITQEAEDTLLNEEEDEDDGESRSWRH